MAEVKKTATQATKSTVTKTASTKNTQAKAPATKSATVATKKVSEPKQATTAKTAAKPAVKKAVKSDKLLKVTLVKSTNKCVIGMKKTVQALGLHRIGETKVHNDNAAIRGAIFKVKHLVKVEEVNAKEVK